MIGIFLGLLIKLRYETGNEFKKNLQQKDLATARNKQLLCVDGCFWHDNHRICMRIPIRCLTDFSKRNLKPHVCNMINLIYSSRGHVVF